MKGKFIVLYGINNTGKSTQAKMLVERLIKEGYKAEYLKYPIYCLEPSGSLINDYLREGNPHNFTRRESQLLNVINRQQYEPILKKKLEQGINIIGEDYAGSGIAWGVGSGVDEKFMKKINSHLLKEDLVFVFDGKRFTEAAEKNHIYETDNELQEKVRAVYAKLAKEFGWIKINANDTIENIRNRIWKTTYSHLN